MPCLQEADSDLRSLVVSAVRSESLTEHLAQVLHAKMEHLDPGAGPPWACMSEYDREFYRACVESVLVAVIAACRPRSDTQVRP
jgi:hypothetical protein